MVLLRKEGWWVVLCLSVPPERCHVLGGGCASAAGRVPLLVLGILLQHSSPFPFGLLTLRLCHASLCSAALMGSGQWRRALRVIFKERRR
jgi:hypothetical protein